MKDITVLTAALALRQFTVDELVAFSGSNRNTVRTILARDNDMFEQLGREVPAGPGRPATKWAVRDSDATRQVAAKIQALPSMWSPPSSPLSLDDQREAIVSVAEDALARVAEHRDPVMQRQVLRSARATLHMVDSAREKSPDAPKRWWADDDSKLAIRAAAIDALATLAISPDGQFPMDALSEIAGKVAAAMEVVSERGAAVYSAPFTQILASRGDLASLFMVPAAEVASDGPGAAAMEAPPQAVPRPQSEPGRQRTDAPTDPEEAQGVRGPGSPARRAAADPVRDQAGGEVTAPTGVPTEVTEAPAAAEEVTPRKPLITDRPIQTVGRRGEAVVRVRLVPGTGQFHLDGRTLEAYFPNKVHQQLIKAPLVTVDRVDSFDVYAHIDGGGPSGQAGALRLAIARALILVQPENRLALQKAGFLTRDPRAIGRKKYGLKKAPKAAGRANAAERKAGN